MIKSLLPSRDEKNTFWDIAFFVISIILVFLIVGVIIMYSAIRPFDIVGDSMEPNLHNGNTVIIQKNYPTPVRGDVVVIKTTHIDQDGTSTQNYIIKRIVAIEGDKIGFVRAQGHDNIIYFYRDCGQGWEQVFEPYTKEYMSFGSSSVVFNKNLFKIYESVDEMKNGGYTVIEKDKFFAMGDNRNVSADSRKYGQFDVSTIAGKEIFVYEKDSFYDRFFSIFFKNKN